MMLKTIHIGALFTAAACRSPAPPLPVAEVSPALAYERVTPAGDRSPSLRFELRWFAVTEPPPGVAVARAAAAIVRERGRPFRGRSALPVGSRWLDDPAARTWQGSDRTAQLQLLGTATAVVTAALKTVVAPARPPLPTMWLRPSDAAAGAVDVTLLSDVGSGAGREALRIERACGADEAGALFVPSDDLGEGGVVVLLTPTGRAASSEVAAADAAAVVAPRPAPTMSPRALAWQVARDAIGAHNRRPALLALVTPFQQARAIDVLIVADERALVAMTGPMTDVDADAPDAGWQLERALWRALLPRVERRALTPALRATVTRHLGALQEDPATLSLLLETCADDAEFGRRVVEENLLTLDDRSAALRATAATFLRRRGVELPGYDPMGTPAARRAAGRQRLRGGGAAR